jgi:hypothetical protein
MILDAPAALSSLTQSWNDFFSHSKLTNDIVTFLHVGGLLLAGGLAVASDRMTFRAMRYPADERRGHVREVAAVHRLVITGLVIVVVSGIALFASDVDTFWDSWVFWVKMGLIVLLLLNGWGMTRVEKRLAVDASEGAPGWNGLHRAAVVSVTLWFAIALAGVILTNV